MIHDPDRLAKFVACWMAWTYAQRVRIHTTPNATVFPTERQAVSIGGTTKWFSAGLLR